MAGQTGEIFAAAATIVFLVVSSTCADNYKYEVKTFNAKIDHFTFTSTKTFPLRYLVNSTWWDPSSHVSPIFFYTGNEGDIETFAQNTGLMWELARSFDALIVFAEHRYYGKSLPFGNLSYSDPKYSGYLSSAQALADYIDLIQHLKEVYPKKDPQAHRTPVIAFGGSYGGMLAAWIRMKYPGIITGSLASSAPIFQFTNMTNCDDFNRIVTSAYRDIGSTKCADNIKKSWASINELAKTDDGKKWLNQTFKPCQQPLDAASLKDWLTNMYVNIAMVNYPYPANFLAPLPAWPVKAVCEVIGGANQSDKPLLEAVSKATTLYFNSTGSLKCNDMNSQGSSGVDVDGWDYQSCTEMVMPLCDNGDTMFEATKWDINALSKQCLTKWKVTPDVNYVQNLYGGKEVASVSNIIFSNGLLDPWSGGGVLYNMSSSAISVILPEAAHHLDLRATNKLDPHSIRRARKLYRTIFKRWVSAFSFSQE